MTKNPALSNDIMFSYRRTNGAFVEELARRLTDNFAISSFIDKDRHIPGYNWRSVWNEQLCRLVNKEHCPGLGPTVVVIATPAANEEKEPDYVVEEILDALQPKCETGQIPIVLLRFGEEGWDVLADKINKKWATGAGVSQDPSTSPLHLTRDLHQPDILDPALLTKGALSDAEWNEIIRPIVRNVRAYFLKKLQDERDKTRSWAEGIVTHRFSSDGRDFRRFQQARETVHQDILRLAQNDGKKSVVVVGSGGLGKTMQVASSILDTLNGERGLGFFPIVLSKEETDNLNQTLIDRLGLTWLDKNSAISLPDEGLDEFQNRICFISDSLEKADSVAKTSNALKRLLAVAKLVITVRPEAWSEAEPILAVRPSDVVKLGEISNDNVTQYLGWQSNQWVKTRPFLRIPVFLDIAKYLFDQNQGDTRALETRLDNETNLLEELKNFSIEPFEGQPSQQIESARARNRKFLLELAEQQILSKTFDVPEATMLKRGFAKSIKFLEQDRKYLVVDIINGQRVIRLGHDLMDSHNLANYLLTNPEVFSEALAILSIGFGQVAFEGIIQTAHDKSIDNDVAKHLLEDFFDEFLRVCDNKGRSDCIAAAWNCTYVITAKLYPFLTLIHKALSASFIEFDKSAETSASQSSVKSKKITDKALVSVASVFGGAAALSVPDPNSQLLNALFEKIGVLKYHGRLVEAVAKLQQVEAVIGFLERKVEKCSEDWDGARYLAVALQDVARGATRALGKEKAREIHQRSLEALDKLARYIDTSTVNHRLTTIRSIENAQAEVRVIAGKPAEPETPITILEFEEGLRNTYGEAPVSYSDWRKVEYYLSRIEEFDIAKADQDYIRLILAVGRVIWHHHSRCSEMAAHTLGAIDHPFARGVLLHALTFMSEDGSETALIQALRQQANYLAAAPFERFKLAFVRSIAEREFIVGKQRFSELASFLSQIDGFSDHIITKDYIELQRYSDNIPTLKYVNDSSPVGSPDWLNKSESTVDVGSELEEKLAFQASSCMEQIEIPCTRSSWANPRRLHVALGKRGLYFKEICAAKDIELTSKPGWGDWKGRDSVGFSEHVEAIAQLYAMFENEDEVASIASVHGVIVTEDNTVIEAQRSLTSSYSPGAWAGSLEEQCKLSDIHGNNGVLVCLLRGMNEEFGTNLCEADIELVSCSLGIEWATGNTALLVYASLNLMSKEFLTEANEEKSDKEIGQARTIPLQTRLKSLRKSDMRYWVAPDKGKTHPTNAARLALIKTHEHSA